MKKLLVILFAFFALTFSQKVLAQVGICKTALSLEDNNFVGSLWEPNGTVNYTEESGVGVYGLVISLNTSDEYLDIYEGHKVSIEYCDDTREVLDIKAAPTSYDNTIVSNRVVNIYQRRVLVYPNYENLTQKQIKRIVIQRTNGKVWIIETTSKRAKKLPKEFANAMQEAVASYKLKVSNNNYFNEDKPSNDKTNIDLGNINIKENIKNIAFINKDGIYIAFDETTDVVPEFIQTDNCPKGSFNYYRSCLGYCAEELLMHYNDKCYFIAFNSFNNNVVFIIPKQISDEKTLAQQDVSTLLEGYVPSISDFANNLSYGVENKSIRQSFVEESLGVTATNNTIKDNIHGFTYIFENGFLNSYKSISGLSVQAIDIKENFPQIFDQIQKNAQKHYSDEISITEYINGQCKYFSTVPMTYLKMASNPQINYNYAMLYCVFFPGIHMEEFAFLVPEAELVSSASNYIVMSCGSYMFTFRDKVLVMD